MTEQRVLLGAEHPEAGMLYLEVIPDSEVGFADIYQITDSLYGNFLVNMAPDWRLREPTFDGRPWDEWVIRQHLSRIYWYSNDEIQEICQKHGLSCFDLERWGEDAGRWKDVPVMVGREEDSIPFTLLSGHISGEEKI